jgi:hypothetical protein
VNKLKIKVVASTGSRSGRVMYHAKFEGDTSVVVPWHDVYAAIGILMITQGKDYGIEVDIPPDLPDRRGM